MSDSLATCGALHIYFELKLELNYLVRQTSVNHFIFTAFTSFHFVIVILIGFVFFLNLSLLITAYTSTLKLI
jgi:hypothetical protein